MSNTNFWLLPTGGKMIHNGGGKTSLITKLLPLMTLMLMSTLAAKAQYLKVTSTGATFGTVSELAADSAYIWLSNPTNSPVTLTGAKFYPIYGGFAFSSPDTNKVILANDSIRIKVKFKPMHNVLNTSTIVLKNNGGRGTTAIKTVGTCNYSKTYYNNSFGLAENPLKVALKAIINNNYLGLGYNSGRDVMFMTVDNKRVNGQGASVNTLECVYTGRLVTGFASRSVAQSAGDFNTEHTFPQSLFSSGEPMVSDIHHLYPSNAPPNGSRSNYPFGVATAPFRDIAINASSKLGSNLLYAPRDTQKGRTARSMLYFVTKYTDYSGFTAPQEAILRLWAKQFPPNAVDQKRNNDIFTAQRNRNPFTDYPQFLDRITSASTTNGGVNTVAADIPESAINYGTVNTGAAEVYSFVVVNTGNANLNVQSPALTVTSGTGTLAFANASGAATTLTAGEAKTFFVSLTGGSAGPLTGTLTFGTNTPAGTITVPINANLVTSLPTSGISFRYQDPVLAPNPASSQFNLTSADFAGMAVKLQVYNAMGATVISNTVSFDAIGNLTINVGNMPIGVYYVKINVGGYSKTYKLVKD